MKYSNQELLNEIRELTSELGHPPSLGEFREQGQYSVSTYYSRFGSWNRAVEQAGYNPNEPDSKVDKDDLIEELRRLADTLEKRPTVSDMNEQGRYWRSTYTNEFGSWNRALEAAGFEPENRGSTIPDDELIQELKRVEKKLGKTPKFSDMEDVGKYDPTTYVQHFGSWNKSLKVAGLESNNQGSQISRRELIDEIVRLKTELGNPPSARQMDEIGKYASATYQRHFGSWSDALDTALNS